MLHAFLLGAMLLAAAPLAAAPLDARHAAVLDAISTEDGCTPAELRTAAAGASIRTLGRAGGRDVVLAQVFASCICGAQNCPYYALALGAGKPRVLLTTFGIGVSTQPDAPLPRLVVRAHDSALVSVVDTYAYRGGRYTQVDSARLREDTHARKSAVAVRFPPGASSTQLHGSASIGWYDAYTFYAGKGQRLLVDGVRSRAGVSLSLYGPDQQSYDLRAGVPLTLRATGTYHLHVENASEHDVPYALTLAIR
jgi:hypothetical protein